jgi:prepilin-type processing-associated H-X9-DG protein
MTLTEVLVVLLATVILALIILPQFARVQRHKVPDCGLNLKQIGICCRIWADDHNGKYPMQISMTNGGAIELALKGDVSAIFCAMSNELDNPMVLICPADENRAFVTNFATLRNSNISYFINLDAAGRQPQTLLSGDDNLMVNGTEVRPGILNLQTNDSLGWTKDRHKGSGNILLGDGSVQQASSADLTRVAGIATNRLAIP